MFFVAKMTDIDCILDSKVFNHLSTDLVTSITTKGSIATWADGDASQRDSMCKIGFVQPSNLVRINDPNNKISWWLTGDNDKVMFEIERTGSMHTYMTNPIARSILEKRNFKPKLDEIIPFCFSVQENLRPAYLKFILESFDSIIIIDTDVDYKQEIACHKRSNKSTRTNEDFDNWYLSLPRTHRDGGIYILAETDFSRPGRFTKQEYIEALSMIYPNNRIVSRHNSFLIQVKLMYK